MINDLPDLSGIGKIYIQQIEEQNKELKINRNLQWLSDGTDWYEKKGLRRMTSICVQDDAWVEAGIIILFYISKRYDLRMFLAIGKENLQSKKGMKSEPVSHMSKTIDAEDDWWWFSLSGEPVFVENPQYLRTVSGRGGSEGV